MLNPKSSPTKIRSGLIVIFGIIVFSLLLSGCGAEKPKVYRVGILSGLDYFINIVDGFKAGMTELGYIEGQNITYDLQRTNFDPVAEEQILKKFVSDKVDLILVFPTEVSLAAKVVTQGTDVPVVFVNAAIEGVNLVNSVQEPGGNITGVRYPGPDIALKRLEIMRQLAPEAKRLWIPYQRGYPIVASQLEVLYPAAETVGVTLIEAPADDAAELEAELQKLAQSPDIGIDAILFIAEPLAVNPEAFTVMGKFAAEHHLPIGGALISVDGYDSLFGVNTDPLDTGNQAAPVADKILKGLPPGSIPVLSANNFLQINYKAAQNLGLTVPEALLLQADEIIR